MYSYFDWKSTRLSKCITTVFLHDIFCCNYSANILPAASVRMYAFSALDSWFEFSKAMQTFLMCCGISSMNSAEHSGGGLIALVTTADTVSRVTHASTVADNIWDCILLNNKLWVQLNLLYRIADTHRNIIQWVIN